MKKTSTKMTKSAKKILLLDDSKEFLELLVNLLHRSELSLEFSTEYEVALNKVKKEKFDLIITDYLMKEVNGLEFSKEVRSIKLNQTTKIILLTAKSLDQKEHVELKNYGLLYFKKPLHPRELQRKIIEVLKL